MRTGILNHHVSAHRIPQVTGCGRPSRGTIVVNTSIRSSNAGPAFDTARRTRFLKALRALIVNVDTKQRAVLLETMVRASRSVGADDAKLPIQAYEELIMLRERYDLIAPCDEMVDPTTYDAARSFIQEIFF